MPQPKPNRNLEFLFELGSFRNVERGWRQHLGTTVANNLEHSMRVVYLALILARMEKVKNEDLVIKMALLHELPEARTSDLSYVQKVYVKADEAMAIKETLAGTVISDLEQIWNKYEKRDCIEAKIVKDADNLDLDLEIKELEERGSKLPAKWRPHRKIAKTKLYTKSAKKLWNEIEKANPASWHLKANKWYRIPGTGK